MGDAHDKRAEALATAIRSLDKPNVCSVSLDTDDPDEVFVRLDNMKFADRVFTIAHDHGFTPNGIVQSGDGVSTRFKPRTETETPL